MLIACKLPRLLVAGVCSLGAAIGAGCAHQSALLAPEFGGLPAAVVELAATPFFPQRDYQCGPAALATVLVASGAATTPDELVTRVYLPGRQGSLQAELLGASRGYDRLPYRLASELGAVLGEVAAGRPVLVLQNLGLKHLPVWHYAVIVGFDVPADEIILRSGTTERLSLSTRRFLRGWQLGGRWAVVLLKPGELPAAADSDRYLEAAAGLEAAQRYQAALQSYRTALGRWPQDGTALLGIGNVHYRQGELGDAESAYRELLARDENNAVARNNLAQVLLEQGNPQAALQEIERARAALTDARFAPLLDATEREIRRALR